MMTMRPPQHGHGSMKNWGQSKISCTTLGRSVGCPRLFRQEKLNGSARSLFLPDQPLHAIQRGNNRGAVFFGEDDYAQYGGWLAEAADAASTPMSS
jgi:hypothetical protein